jgi:hypothetical protein
LVGRHSSQCHVACVCWAIDCCNMAGRHARAGLGRKVRRRKLTERPHAMPKQSKSAPLPLPAGGSRAHTPFFLPSPFLLASPPHHTHPHPSYIPTPVTYRQPLLLPATDGMDWIFSFPFWFKGDATALLTRESSVKSGQVRSGQVMVLWPRRGPGVAPCVLYLSRLVPPVIDDIGRSVNRSVCRSVRLHHDGLRSVAWCSGDVCRVEYCMDGKQTMRPIQS